MFSHLLKSKKFLLVIVCLVPVVFSSDVEKKDYYRAAVFEYKTYSDESHTLEETLKKHLDVYDTVARVASENGADIIVFPEDGLYPSNDFTRLNSARFSEQIPNPKVELTNPCEQVETFFNRPVLSKLSCLAKKNKLYLVANMVNFEKCSFLEPCNVNDTKFCINKHCSDDGMLLYNTNVIFDREGTLIAKYYKRHRFLEYDKDLPKNRESVFFDTEFGKFTTFVCFDLIYNETIQAVENPSVRNVAYPTFWYDHFPLMYFATAYQQAWAMEFNVNLLAADGHTIGSGSLGSGIYSGSKGALVYTHNPDSHSRLLISNVPKDPSKELSELNVKRFILDGTDVMEEKEEKSDVFKGNSCETNILGSPQDMTRDYRCGTMNTAKYKYVKLAKSEDSIEICANNMCCSLSYKAKTWNEDYFLGVYDDLQIFKELYGFATEGCFLLRCDSLDSAECKRYVLKSETVFDYVELKGNYSVKHVLPYAIDSGVRLTDRSQYKVKEKNFISYENQNTNSSLLFLALYGRNYEKDVDLLNGF